MFNSLPTVFKSSALIDRIHGFIEGWEIPRMNEGLKVNGWALNSEYFTTIMHLLREDTSYRAIVDRIIEYPEDADTRHTEAIKRLSTAFLKLLFPHVRNVADVNEREFERYCLRPARIMRRIILKQLALIDREYAGKDLPKYIVNIKKDEED